MEVTWLGREGFVEMTYVGRVRGGDFGRYEGFVDVMWLGRVGFVEVTWRDREGFVVR